jgi:hypothetical protein
MDKSTVVGDSMALKVLDFILDSFCGFIFRTKQYVFIAGACFFSSNTFKDDFRRFISHTQDSAFLCQMKPLRVETAKLALYFDERTIKRILSFYSSNPDSDVQMRESSVVSDWPVSLFWQFLLDILKRRERVVVCNRCAEEAKTNMLNGRAPLHPFVFRTENYICHSLLLHGQILPEDFFYICKQSSECTCECCGPTPLHLCSLARKRKRQ